MIKIKKVALKETESGFDLSSKRFILSFWHIFWKIWKKIYTVLRLNVFLHIFLSDFDWNWLKYFFQWFWFVFFYVFFLSDFDWNWLKYFSMILIGIVWSMFFQWFWLKWTITSMAEDEENWHLEQSNISTGWPAR